MEQEGKNKTQHIIGMIKGVLVGVMATLVLVLLFSLIIKITIMNEKFILPINQVIKAISVFIGVFICVKEQRQHGLIKGIAVGLLISLINYLVFSVISKEWIFNLKTFLDLLLSCAMGAVSGIIAVNLKKD